MLIATEQFKKEVDDLFEKRKREIRGALSALDIENTENKIYYVSNNGDDSNDGLSAESAWRTTDRVSAADLCPGDAVLFCRGDIFRGGVVTRSGVSYGAYGEGEKPCIYGWDEDLASVSLWEEYDSEHHIWRYVKPIPDCGTLVFNGGECCSIKLIPSYDGTRFVCRDDESRAFDMREQMVRDLDIYWHFDSITTKEPSKGQDFAIPVVDKNSFGELYLRSDRGNPGEIFDSIEPLVKRVLFEVGGNSDVHIDNLCLKYTGNHAIAAGGKCVCGLKVTNCEIGWIGGSIQHYYGLDPNYPEGGRGSVTRFGNGVEIYGGCDQYEVSDCYIYQVYDAGITHQITTCGEKYVMKNVLYRGNVIERCVYSIEYFLEMNRGDTESYMQSIEICNNLMRESGYGWGQQRHNTDTPAHVKGWSYENRAFDFKIHHNIFDRAAYRMLHLVAKEASSCPCMYENTYIQHEGGRLGLYGPNAESAPEELAFDLLADKMVERVFGERDAKVYLLAEGTAKK